MNKDKLTVYKAKDGDRVDNIVYEFYSDLASLEKVIQLNADLPEVLNAGDIVLLPAYIVKTKEKKLW